VEGIVELPLFDIARVDDGTFVRAMDRSSASGVSSFDDSATVRQGTRAKLRARMPDRRPGPGEQYRFHIDMDACIGCKCCVVACNEQNGNPSDVQWRRVAELEGGRFPRVRRAYASMGCNHCADPTCLAGCPTDAYTKDAATGIVRHSAETCIGCQYCTWTCSYGVPQFNAERGVVGKCDMCHGRLAEGREPACVSACPEGAIGIEIVNLAEWRAMAARAGEGPATETPAGDGSLSTSRATLPNLALTNLRPTDALVFEPGEPHWPLVCMTVLTQMSVGLTLAALIAVAAGGSGTDASSATAVALGALAVGLAASTLHLGRPVYALRAVRMWRRSWLSREVLLFGLFGPLLGVFAALDWLQLSSAAAAGLAASAVGLAGVLASARIYHVTSRPLWNGIQTDLQFFMTTILLGTLGAVATGLVPVGIWPAAAIGVAAVQALILIVFLHLIGTSETRELRGAEELLSTVLRWPAAARVLLLATGGIVLPLLAEGVGLLAAALGLVVVSELLGRYLFFTAAVPRHMTAAYLPVRTEAA
jgi:formate dehydrogenase iron-sulfur subunit